MNPSNPTVGRSALLFAALISGFGLVLLATRASWRDGALWLAIGVFMACYGAISLDLFPVLRRAWLLIGLIAGGVAFWLVLMSL